MQDLVEFLKAQNKENAGQQEQANGAMGNMKVPTMKVPSMKMPKL